MTLSIPATVRAAWRLGLRQRTVLLPLTGLFVFVPQLAVLLLVPEAPPLEEGADPVAWAPVFEAWVSANAGLYIGAALLVQFGTFAALALFVSPARSVGAAMRHAATLFLRYVLAAAIVTIPLAVPMLVLMRVPVLLPFAVTGLFYVLARASMVGPVVLAEPGVGAMAAVVRSWRLTRGQGVRLAALIGALLLGGSLIASVIAGLDTAMHAGGLANPVMSAIIASVASLPTWASTLAVALVEVIAYRVLSSRGT